MSVLPLAAAAPRRPWWSLRGTPAWVHALRAVGAVLASAALGVAGTIGLGLLAFVLLPTCTYSEPAPLTLRLAAAGCLGSAAVVPALVAGLRLWWIGVPASALAVHAIWPLASSLLSEPQTGFCF